MKGLTRVQHWLNPPSIALSTKNLINLQYVSVLISFFQSQIDNSSWVTKLINSCMITSYGSVCKWSIPWSDSSFRSCLIRVCFICLCMTQEKTFSLVSRQKGISISLFVVTLKINKITMYHPFLNEYSVMSQNGTPNKSVD